MKLTTNAEINKARILAIIGAERMRSFFWALAVLLTLEFSKIRKYFSHNLGRKIATRNQLAKCNRKYDLM